VCGSTDALSLVAPTAGSVPHALLVSVRGRWGGEGYSSMVSVTRLPYIPNNAMLSQPLRAWF
jgi:hypothetical protein